MTNSDRVLLVSADSHAAAPPESFRPYFEERFLDRLDDLKAENERFLRYTSKLGRFPDEALDVIDADGSIRSGGIDGSFDVERRLKEMDREGIVAEVVLPGAQPATMPFFGATNEAHPAELRAAGARAYHRWLADVMVVAKGRLISVANCGPCRDMDETIADLTWAAEHGFRSATVPGILLDPELPRLADPYYEPYWRTCAEHGLVLSVHAGHGHPQGKWMTFLGEIFGADSEDDSRQMLQGLLNKKGGPLDLDLIPAQVMWTLMLSGVFDRYPNLQLALTEVRADWVPATLRILDERYAAGDTTLLKSPSEYWHSNCWTGASSIKESEIRLRSEIGVERIMFGRDYPHAESTWPNTFDWFREAFADVPEGETRAIVGENAIRCYGLDPAPLQAIAERIGPRFRDVFGPSQAVDPRIVDHFAERAGYRKTYEHIDATAVQDLFERDIASRASS